MKLIRLLLPAAVWAILATAPLPAVPSLIDQGRNAETAENYQKAIELYRNAMEVDPKDPAPAKALADLFTSKGLYSLALPVWTEVVRRDPADSDAWVSLAQDWAYLDDNRQSVRTLEGARERFPDDAEVVEALAWMLFKTEEYRRGIALTEAFLTSHGPDRTLEMTLGTLYSSILDYGMSRVHYLRAIALAPGRSPEDQNFRSIVWYNLSLLEKDFYRFDLADQAVRKSLDEEDRPAGDLALGELYQDRRDFTEAQKLFQKAVQADKTPLGRFDLARLYQQFGLLDEAEAQVVLVENNKDDTWIYDYGVTKNKVLRDIHGLRSDLHKARFHLLDFTPRTTPWDWAAWGWAKVKEGLTWWYHDQAWKNLLVKESESSLAVRNSPDAWAALTLAFREQPDLALKYLALARTHELPQNPRADASYLVEEGVIRRDSGLLEWALTKSQNPWENSDRERTLATLAEIRKSQGKTAEARKLLATLYALNPGCLPSKGFGLPVRSAVYGDQGNLGTWKAALDTYAFQTGWDAGSADRPGVTWTLELNVTADGAAWTLRDPEGKAVRSGSVPRSPDSPVTAIAEIFRGIHTPR